MRISPLLSGSVITSTTSDTVVGGILTVCPGAAISLTCSYDMSTDIVTRWEVSSPSCAVLIGHDPPNTGICGSFNIGMVSNISEATRSSTATATTVEELDGAVVVCRDGSSGSDPQVGTVTIRVIGEMPKL